MEQALNELYQKAEQFGKIVGCSGCTKLEYLQSTGTQYIDTGFTPNQDTTVETRYNFSDLTGNNKSVFGSRFDYNTSHYGLTVGGNNNYFYGYNSFSVDTNVSASINTDYTVRKEKNKLYVNDIKIYEENYSSFTSPHAMYIFAMNQQNNALFNSSIKLYYLKIYDDDNLVRDYIPVLDNNDRPCMFDKVSKNCFYNQGSGEFLYNNYTKLDYIESTGTQYIDTGFTPSQDTKVETRYNFSNLNGNNNKTVFGSRFSYYESHYGLTVGGNNNYFNGYNSSSVDTNVSASINTDYTVRKEKNKLYVNDTKINEENYSSFTSSYSMYIFAMNQRNSAEFKSVIKLYYLKTYDNDTLVRDYIPVLDSNDRPCLFDKVSKTCFYNQGTGEFLYG